MNIKLSWPSAFKTCCIATSEPSASPSGCSWVTTTSLQAPRRVSMTAARPASTALGSLTLLILGDLFPDQLRDPQAAIDRVVVIEGQRRGVLEPQSVGHAPL